MITTKTSGMLTRVFRDGRHIGTVEAFGKNYRWTVSSLYSANKVRIGWTNSVKSAKQAIIIRATVNL